MGKRGRPPKESKGVSFTIYAPRYEDYIYLKEKAKRMGVSLSALIFSYIAAADEQMAERIVEHFREVEQKLENLRKEVDVATIVRKVEKIQIPKEIEEDPEFQNAISHAVHQLRAGKQHIAQVLEWLLPIFEVVSMRHGYVPESRSKAKMYLITKLLRKQPH